MSCLARTRWSRVAFESKQHTGGFKMASNSWFEQPSVSSHKLSTCHTFERHELQPVLQSAVRGSSSGCCISFPQQLYLSETSNLDNKSDKGNGCSFFRQHRSMDPITHPTFGTHIEFPSALRPSNQLRPGGGVSETPGM